MAAVVAEYFDSQQFFASKSAGTQRMRRGILERFRAAYGDRPFALLPPEWIEALLDPKPPHAARSWLVTLRSLCRFALKRGWLRADPTANIKLRAIKGDGFHTWTEDEIAQFEAHHPIGSKPRLGLALLLYTAQRRSDVVRMGRQHIKDGVLTVKQQKTGVTLAIPVHPQLRTVLDATPSEHLTFLVTATGKPYGGNAFSEQFRNWCDAAGLPTALQAARAAQGGLSAARGSRMQRERDHGDQRTHDDERDRPLHRRRRSGAARPQCDGADGRTKDELKWLGENGVPATFNARSADLMGLKMRRITRGASFDHLVSDGKQAGGNTIPSDLAVLRLRTSSNLLS